MRPTLEHLRLVSDSTVVARHDVAAEFPTIFVSHEADARSGDPVIDGEAWRRASSFRPFDDAVETAATNAVVVRDGAMSETACEVLTRFQRFVDRRNAWSRTALFDAILAEHRALHDTTKPLVKADFDHALDTWQWLLRLSPSASLAVQLAALFHDIERLESESERRVEQHAPDYQAFKDRHARRGAEQSYAVLVQLGIHGDVARRTHTLIGTHEKRGVDAEVDLLNDADALSFFSLNSAGYADYFGPEQTRKKIAYTLARLSPAARTRLAHVRLRDDVRAMLEEAAHS